MTDEEDTWPPTLKMKSKLTNMALQTLDLNYLVMASDAIIPAGPVNSRVNQLDGGTESSG